MDRVEIAKEEEQKAFLETLLVVLEKHALQKHFVSVTEAMKFLRRSIHQGPSQLNGELARAVFAGTRLFPLLARAVSFIDPPDKTEELFGSARTSAIKQGATDSDRSLWYLVRHPRNVWSALMSTHFGHKVLGKIFPFDPKGFAKNISGLLFEEKRGSVSIDWLVGPTPTLGNRLAPEMERALEVLEEDEKWVYVNLQNLGSASERSRSLALLDASKRHPGRFFVASLSVDSPLYLDKDRMDIDEHRKRLLQELSRAVFLNDSTWYFFSLKADDKEKWWSIVEEVVEKAFLLCSGKALLFHELLILGLVRAWQAFHIEKVKRLISTVACKECIDRGGSVNAAFLWALLGEQVNEKQRSAQVMAVLWGRPLLAKKRLIEKTRTKGFQAIVEAFSSEDIHSYLEAIWHQATTLTGSSFLVL